MKLIAFKSAKQYKATDLLKETFPFLLISSAIALFIYFNTTIFRGRFTFLVPLLIPIKEIYDKGKTNRISAISFDTGNHEIIYTYKALFSNEKTEKVNFSKTSLQTDYVKSLFSKQKSLVIHFYKDKTEILELKEKKDLFSKQAMEEVKAFAGGCKIFIRER